MIRILKNVIRKFIRPVFIVLRNTVRGYNRDKVWHMGASIAYYTIFSLPAILIIVIALVGFFLGEAAVEGRVYSTLVKFVGENPALQIQDAVKNIGSPSTNWWMTIFGFAFLVFMTPSHMMSLNPEVRIRDQSETVSIGDAHHLFFWIERSKMHFI
jgi:membrane protein